jgi:hypothetical protein
MIVKVLRRFWLLLLLILLTPLAFNLRAIKQEYGVHRYYEVSGAQYDLWKDLAPLLLTVAIPLGIVSCAAIWLSLSMKGRPGRRLRTWLYALLVFMIILASTISGFGSLLLDIQWSSVLRDGVLGPTVSDFLMPNLILASSSTVALLLAAVYLSMRGRSSS